MRIAVALLGLYGCGRIAFDPRTDALDQSDLPLCLDDSFEGASQWTHVLGAWTLQARAGRDGSTAFGSTMGENLVAHPLIGGVTEVHVSVDFRIIHFNGDFNVALLKAPIGDWSIANGYEGGIFPLGGDTAIDAIDVWHTGVQTTLVQRPRTVSLDVWYRADFWRRADGSLRLDLDGAVLLETGPELDHTPPFDVAIRLFGAGLLDNVRVHCR